MKAERRHELKTNALARGLEGFPYYWRTYGSQALLVVLIALIVFMLVRYWNEKKARQAEELTSSMAQVQQNLRELDQLPMGYMSLPSDKLADERKRIAQDADAAIANVLSTAKDSKLVAAAWSARGELDWKLANLPDPPGAETQPALAVGNKDTLLSDSRSAFEQVLQPQYSSDVEDVFAARLGLAAIAENQNQWDKAREQYQAIADAASMPGAFKQYAHERIADLPKYERPVYLGPPATLPSLLNKPQTAATEPSVLGPTVPAQSAPASQPSTPAPTTEPMPATHAPATTQPAASQPG
jgi:predicted negative regulator of RcsB-dependent stress response